MPDVIALGVQIIEKEAALLGLRVVILMHRDRDRGGVGLRPLAQRTHIPVSTLQKICRGDGKQPSIWTIRALARGLQTTTDYLCGLSDEPRRDAVRNDTGAGE